MKMNSNIWSSISFKDFKETTGSFSKDFSIEEGWRGFFEEGGFMAALDEGDQ